VQSVRGSDVDGRADIVFRAAGRPDVDAVVELVQSAYRGDTSRKGWTTEADLLDGQRTDAEEVSQLIDRPASIILLGTLDGRLVGSCHLERHGGTARFGMFAVDPVLQGGGIGRALLEEASRTASAWGCDTLRMTVISVREDLIAWYTRLGFRATGETEPFPYGDQRFGIPLRDDLEFVVLSTRITRRGFDTSAAGEARR
jgi:GNAT superfamily N-acetyltransferase